MALTVTDGRTDGHSLFCNQIEQSDVISRLTHVRLVTLLSVLAAVDMAFVVVCAMRVMETGPSVFILFGFEVR